MFLATIRRHRCGGESSKHFAFESKTICRRLGVSNRGSLCYVQTSVPIVPFRLPFWVLINTPASAAVPGQDWRVTLRLASRMCRASPTAKMLESMRQDAVDHKVIIGKTRGFSASSKKRTSGPYHHTAARCSRLSLSHPPPLARPSRKVSKSVFDSPMTFLRLCLGGSKILDCCICYQCSCIRPVPFAYPCCRHPTYLVLCDTTLPHHNVLHSRGV